MALDLLEWGSSTPGTMPPWLTLLLYALIASVVAGTSGFLALWRRAVVSTVGASGWVLAICCALPLGPLVWWCCREALKGRWISERLPPEIWAPILAVGLLLAGALAWHVIERLTRAPGTRLRRLGCVMTLLFVAAAIHHFNGKLYRGLYPEVHLALVGVLLLIGVAAARTMRPTVGGRGLLVLGVIVACCGFLFVPLWRSHDAAARGLWQFEDLQTPRHVVPWIATWRTRGDTLNSGHPEPVEWVEGWRAQRHAARERLNQLLPQRFQRVAIISVDALRADHCSFLGYEKPTTPFLESIASNCFVFTEARSSAPNSMFALRSLLSGQSPSTILESRGESLVTLAHVLGARGVRTGAIFNEIVLGGKPVESLGFQYHVSEARSEAALPMLNQMIAAVGTGPFLAWSHVMDPHAPYVAHPGPDFGSDDLGRYNSEIHHVDRHLRSFWEKLQLSGVADKTVLVITADHGEGLGQGGEQFHGSSLSEHQIRVPLLVYVPGLEGRRIDVPVSTGSVAATVADLVGANLPREEEYPSLLPLMLDLEGSDRLFSVSERYSSLSGAGSRSLRSIQFGNYKMTHDLQVGFRALHDVRIDPDQRRDLAEDMPTQLWMMERLEESWERRRRQLSTSTSGFPLEYAAVCSALDREEFGAKARMRSWLEAKDEAVRRDAATRVLSKGLRRPHRYGRALRGFEGGGARGDELVARASRLLGSIASGQSLGTEEFKTLIQLSDEDRWFAVAQMLSGSSKPTGRGFLDDDLLRPLLERNDAPTLALVLAMEGGEGSHDQVTAKSDWSVRDVTLLTRAALLSGEPSRFGWLRAMIEQGAEDAIVSLAINMDLVAGSEFERAVRKHWPTIDAGARYQAISAVFEAADSRAGESFLRFVNQVEKMAMVREHAESKLSLLRFLHAPPSLNQRALAPDLGDELSFLVIGHAYGKEPADPSLPPRALQRLASKVESDDFIVCLGDTFYRFEERGPTVELLNSIRIPVYNAPGNHDYVLPGEYADAFGTGQFAFVRNRALFVVTNTEISPGRLDVEQLEILRSVLNRARRASAVDRLFLFSHRVLLGDLKRYSKVKPAVNVSEPRSLLAHMGDELIPLVRGLFPEPVPIYWFMGDVGSRPGKTLLVDRDPSSGVVFVLTGVGMRPEDHALRVVVPAEGEARLSVVPLGARAPTLEGSRLFNW